MNCQRFQKVLFEYLDGTLSARTRSRADNHLLRCAACRQVLNREQTMTKAFSEMLRQTTEPLTLPQHAQRRVLRAIERSTGARAKLFWQPFAWPQAIAAVALLVALLIGAFLFHVRVPNVATNPARNAQNQAAVSIETLYLVPIYTFRQEGNTVIDTLAYETNRVNVVLRMDDGYESATKQQGGKARL